MSRQERWGTRDLTYSRWHRTLPDDITYIDLDGVEYCQRCYKILALVETAQDVGQEYKATTVLRRVAEGHKDMPLGILILYKKGDVGLERARVKRVAPGFGEWVLADAVELGDFLIKIHREHRCNA